MVLKRGKNHRRAIFETGQKPVSFFIFEQAAGISFTKKKEKG